MTVLSYSCHKVLEMKNLGSILLAFGMLVLLCGCTREEEKVADEVLMRVNDEVLTSRALDGQIALRMKVMRRKYAKREDSLARIGEYEKKLRATAAQAFVEKAVFVSYAKNNGVLIEQDELEGYLQKAAAFYGFGNVEGLKKEFSADEYAVFENTARFELLAEKGEKALDDSIVASVSEKDVDDGFVKLDQVNAAAQATNVLVFARATNVYERIKSGEITFADAAKTYSEDNALVKNGLWGTFKNADLKAREPKLDALLKGAKKGDVLPPIECDNAVAIVKVGTSINETVALYRVLFRLAAEWEIPTREKLREVLEYNKFKELKGKRVEELFASSKIWGRDDPAKKKEEAR